MRQSWYTRLWTLLGHRAYVSTRWRGRSKGCFEVLPRPALDRQCASAPEVLRTNTVLLVDIDDLLHLIIAAHEDSAAIVDMLGYDLDHALHLAVHRLAASYPICQ